MRIAEVRVTPVAIPDMPLINCKGVHQPYALRAIIEIVCEDGTVGIAEGYGGAKALAGQVQAAPGLVGLDPFNLNDLSTRVRASLPEGGGVNAKTAVADHQLTDVVTSFFEVALLDIQGKRLGRPVSDLLGGKVRETIPFSAYLFFKFAGHPGAAPDRYGEVLTPDAMVEEARDIVGRYGFRALKLKGGVLEPDLEIETMLKLREAFPHHPLRIDPNGAWTIETAIRFARRLEGVLEYLEDPVLGMDAMAEVARHTSIPLATNLAVIEYGHLGEAYLKKAVKIVLADHHYWGGLRSCTHLGKICQALEFGVSMHSNTHLGISLAAMAHAGAAIPNVGYACDTHYPWTDGHDVIETPFVFRDGAINPPEGPGLGVTLDPEKVAALALNYSQGLVLDRDDTLYMKQFDPGYERRVPRW